MRLGWIIGLVVLGSASMAFAQTPHQPSTFELFQSVFQLGTTTGQQIQMKVNEMQGKIDSLGRELEEAKKSCPAAPTESPVK